MIKIRIPNSHVAERSYAIDVIMDIFLGIEYDLDIANIKNNEFYFGGKKKLVIADSFFSRFDDGLSYISPKSLPHISHYLSNEFTFDHKLPLLYGDDTIELKDGCINCYADIIASVFFMITRWEECLDGDLDEHGRFPAKRSAVYQFIDRPLVNEYCEMFWNMLVAAGYSGKRRLGQYELVLTHDIDRLYEKKFNELLKDYSSNHNIKRLIAGLYYFFFRPDPFVSFDYIMNESEKLGIKSRFYFLCGSNIAHEVFYSIKSPMINFITNAIVNRKHVMGFHPGYDTFIDEGIWKDQLKLYTETIGLSPEEGRQHYLRFKNPDTWRIWDNNGLKIDSSLGLSDTIGYRCGTGNTYPVFDILNRKKLALCERPLIIMDAALKKMGRRKQTEQLVKKIIERSKKYGMPMTVLFHNHTLDNVPIINLRKIYRMILNG
jgi:hypothetical protein